MTLKGFVNDTIEVIVSIVLCTIGAIYIFAPIYAMANILQVKGLLNMIFS